MAWTNEARYRSYESMTIEKGKKFELSVSASPWMMRSIRENSEPQKTPEESSPLNLREEDLNK